MTRNPHPGFGVVRSKVVEKNHGNGLGSRRFPRPNDGHPRLKVRTSPAADAGRPRTAKATSLASVVGATGLRGGILCSGFKLGKEKVLRMKTKWQHSCMGILYVWI